MDRFVPPFHDAIRANYPQRDEITVQQMQVDFGPNGVNLNQAPLMVWQFASPDRKLALVLSANSLAFHTVAYSDHQSFIEAFRSALLNLVAVPQIGIAWTNGVAMRYVDLVASTKDGDRLDDLLKPSVLPPPFRDVADLNIVEGLYVARYQTPKADVRFQILRNPATVLPQDLITPLVQMNSWQMERPTTEFAIVDTDCSVSFNYANPMDVDNVCGHMYELRFVAKSIFLNIGTEYAEKLWRRET
jgi:uncharacterized protein (TIGR04255 family)